ncbi:putative coiled-coil protein [Piedraia hortae CBS 480.64]|uniref:Putative coiled-coil protein n=1 Tax=Piedraia hortae CBS 480.64 TaxID=1314780 RepID=A0A6A7C5E9_9PEZI|nr:putative coiled-coil protein [Piedraia hortae CBS 480.64]
MVYYFRSTAVMPAAFIYVGKDKVENEELIAHGWDEDVWFHVDNLSSAHVYLRLRVDEGETWDSIPKDLLTDCVQLTKANSIEGNKKDNVNVIYTPWSNLKKTGDMVTGQVGFKNDRLVKKVLVSKRENAIVNRLNKTKVEKFPNLRQEKEDRDRELRKRERIMAETKKKEDQRIVEERSRLKWQKEHMYDELHTEENMAESSNQDRDPDFLDEFM